MPDGLFTRVGAVLAGPFPAGSFESLVRFAAGTFLYVGGSDLPPEAHRRFNLKVVGAVLGAAALMPPSPSSRADPVLRLDQMSRR